VGCGLRVRYIGPELYQGGQLLGLRMPDNSDAVGKTPAQLYDFSQAKTFPVSKEWVTLTWKPVAPEEFEYADTAALSFKHSLAFTVTGTTNVSNLSASFEYEYITHMEYIGAVDAITRSHSNIVDMSRIRNATMKDKPSRHTHARLMRSIMNIGEEVVHTASPMVRESIQQSAAQMFVSGLKRAGSSALNYVRSIPASIESSAMSALRRTFSGGLLESIAPALEMIAL